MFRTFSTTRRQSARLQSARSTVASLALALALTGGLAIGSIAVTSDAAQAQRNRGNSASQNSRGFAQAYQPVAAMVQPETANFEGARAALPGLIAAIENEHDRMAAGNLVLNVANHFSDPVMQRQGLEMMLQSGLVAPEQVGQFHWFVGSLAFQAEDYGAARTAMQAAIDAGFSDPTVDLVGLIAETFSRQDNSRGAFDYVMGQQRTAEAAGGTLPENTLLSVLQDTYDNEMGAQAIEVAGTLLSHYPTQRNWENSLRIVNQLYELEPAARVDLFRLMRLNDAIVDRSEYVRYIEDLDPRLMSNEVETVLAHGLAAGVFTQTDPYYVEVKGIADTRAPGDRNGADRMVAEARSGDAIDAQGAGDVLYSLGEFAQAEEMYRLALTKGADANLANTRIGIAQAEQHNYAGALESFGQVTGNRAPVARMWIAYCQHQLAGA
ncbi:MAG: hypothetical protein KDE15_00295 [Erythrobacter sp.]|nr:hypothetical protein [Erythrobacter sp.]